jgi:hypothetical protein
MWRNLIDDELEWKKKQKKTLVCVSTNQMGWYYSLHLNWPIMSPDCVVSWSQLIHISNPIVLIK